MFFLVRELFSDPTQIGLELDEERRVAVESEVDGGDGLSKPLQFGGVASMVGGGSGERSQPRHRP
jgi:hypothetical protein